MIYGSLALSDICNDSSNANIDGTTTEEEWSNDSAGFRKRKTDNLEVDALSQPGLYQMYTSTSFSWEEIAKAQKE